MNIESLKRHLEPATYQELHAHVQSLVTGQRIALEMHNGTKWKSPADVHQLIARRVVDDGGRLMYRDDDGTYVPLTQGLQGFAKSKPYHVDQSEPAAKPQRKDYADEPSFFRALTKHHTTA